MEQEQKETKEGTKEEASVNPALEGEPGEVDIEEIANDFGKQEDQRNIIIQYRNIYNYGVMTGDGAQIESVRIGNKKEREAERTQSNTNLLEDEGRLNSWLMENYERYSMAVVFAGAVFDSFPYQWVIEAANALYQSFDKTEEEKRYGITDTLNLFGMMICTGEVNTYTGKVPMEIICLSNCGYREKILKFFWRECPQLHDRIISWLRTYSIRKRISMSKAAMKVMGLLAGWDYYYFLNNMVVLIGREKQITTDMVIAQVALLLYRNENYQSNMHNLMKTWNREKQVHFLLTNLLICAGISNESEIMEGAIGRYVSGTMEELRDRRRNEYLKNMYDFFAAGMRAFTFYKILIEKIYDLVRDGVTVRERKTVSEFFLILFAADINLTNFESGEDAVFVRLCLKDNKVKDKLCSLWELVWQCRDFRPSFYRLLSEYDRKMCVNGRNGAVEQFVKKALGNVCTKEMQQDICSKVHRRVDDE